MQKSWVLVIALAAAGVAAQQAPNPRQQPGGSITMFAPDQHDLYDGHYVMSANRIYMVGGLNDPEGWDHMDNQGGNCSGMPQARADRAILALRSVSSNVTAPNAIRCAHHGSPSATPPSGQCESMTQTATPAAAAKEMMTSNQRENVKGPLGLGPGVSDGAEVGGANQ